MHQPLFIYQPQHFPTNYLSGNSPQPLRAFGSVDGWKDHHISGIGVTFFTTLAGDPIATEKSGMFLVTTLPAPMVHPFPMVTPGMIVTLPPIQQSSPMMTGLAYSMLSRRDCTSVSWVAANMDTKGPNITRFPISTMPQSNITRLAKGEGH
ncbi:hypothetical protein F4860DRAFT_124879 [Xylaria cubensis]|nr:hypothetical protein F4860DRAFT_124879 [Xylaria cubensis]